MTLTLAMVSSALKISQRRNGMRKVINLAALTAVQGLYVPVYVYDITHFLALETVSLSFIRKP